MARNRLRPVRRDAVLDTTSLVHECFIRFANSRRLQIEDRVHFFRYAGQVMRSVIVDLARASLADRRGGARDAEYRGGRFDAGSRGANPARTRGAR
jgi:hypothetical protein